MWGARGVRRSRGDLGVRLLSEGEFGGGENATLAAVLESVGSAGGSGMQKTMQAVVKPSPAPGAEIREVKVPEFGRTDVLVKVKVASICGTDLHIYEWDRWAQGPIHPTLIPGHAFSAHVFHCGDDVTSLKHYYFL